MGDIVFNCPHCGKRLEVEDEGAGLQVPCPECGKSLRIPASDNLSRSQAGQQPTEHLPQPPRDLSASGPAADVCESGLWRYRYGREGKETSEPLTMQKLAELAKYAVITKLTPVKKEGWIEYRQALNVPELLAAFKEAESVSRPVKHTVAVLLSFSVAIIVFAVGYFVACHFDLSWPQLLRALGNAVPMFAVSVFVIAGVLLCCFLAPLFYRFRFGTSKEVRWVLFSGFSVLAAAWFACLLVGRLGV